MTPNKTPWFSAVFALRRAVGGSNRAAPCDARTVTNQGRSVHFYVTMYAERMDRLRKTPRAPPRAGARPRPTPSRHSRPAGPAPLPGPFSLPPVVPQPRRRRRRMRRADPPPHRGPCHLTCCRPRRLGWRRRAIPFRALRLPRPAQSGAGPCPERGRCCAGCPSLPAPAAETGGRSSLL